MTPDTVIRELGLLPHPEGGYFRETFRAEALPFELPDRGPRSASTSIYFLLRDSDFSALHRVRSDEVWHHYAGVALELHTLDDGHGHRVVRLGSNLSQGERPQHVVPANVLQGARLAAPGFALCGCTVAPGFDFADFEMPPRGSLIARFPGARAVVELLTRA